MQPKIFKNLKIKKKRMHDYIGVRTLCAPTGGDVVIVRSHVVGGLDVCVFDVPFHVQHGHVVHRLVFAHVHVATIALPRQGHMAEGRGALQKGKHSLFPLFPFLQGPVTHAFLLSLTLACPHSLSQYERPRSEPFQPTSDPP